MRKTVTLKTMLRTPVKTILTFLLIAMSSFTLFSHVADYSITTREAAKIKDSCYGVAALDNTVPNITVFKNFSEFISYAKEYEVEDIPWPSEEQLKEFSSLPGATLTDIRYMTAGLVEDYKRFFGDDVKFERCVIEGTYAGYEEYEISTGISTGDSVWLIFDDVKALASERELEGQVKIKADLVDTNAENYSREYYDGLEKGTRCLVIAGSSEGLDLMMFAGKDFFRVVDGLDENYLETEEFSFYKGMADAISQSVYTYDIVYTSDTRAIPHFNEGGMEISDGRGLTAEDTDACVVNELFLEAYGMSIGDRISVKLGDILYHQSVWDGATAWSGEEVSNFTEPVELEIVGTYRILGDRATRVTEDGWMYTASTVFVPSKLLPIEVPEDYETAKGEYSVLIEDAGNIRKFRDAAKLSADEMGVGLIFSDGGWLNIEESFEAAQAASKITAVLYIIGVGIALVLAVYLYIGRNRQEYAIMRALGVSEKEAGNAVILPFAVLSAAMPIGGAIGFYYVSETVAEALEKMAGGISGSYVPNVEFPMWLYFLCLFMEVAFTAFIAMLFLRSIKKTPPLELLAGQQRIGGRYIARNKEAYDIDKSGVESYPCIDSAFCNLEGTEAGKLSTIGKLPSGRKYGAIRHVTAYVLRHMRRGIGKTAASLLLVIVLLSGVGTLVLARITFREAFQSVEVKGKALQYSSESIAELSESDMLDDFYYNGSFFVYVNGFEQSIPMTFTNDLDHYIAGDYTVSYADGYDISVLEGTGAACLVSQDIAQSLDISPGDKISLLSYILYTVMESEAEDEEELQAAALAGTQAYTVAGVIESENKSVSGIFSSANYAAEQLYGRPFLIEHSEFRLSDNRRLDELELLLEEKQKYDLAQYSPRAAYYMNSGKLEDIERLCSLLESLFPIAVAAAAAIGLLGSGLVILQSAKEAAFLRILGVTKKRARCMLVFEQVILCLVGITLVVGGMILYNPGLFVRSTETLAVCYALYFLESVCGASAAAVQVTRRRILELLQVKE